MNTKAAQRLKPLPNDVAVERALRTFLRALGEDPKREGLTDTPSRFLRAMREMTQGYGTNVPGLLGRTFAAEEYDDIVLVQGIEFTSLCEHHLFPFHGTADVAYLPGEHGRIVGLSKIPRVVQAYARRLQVQERLTRQIGTALAEHLTPRGVAVVVRGRHGCMSDRGIRCRGTMTTSHMSGVFRDEDGARAEVLSLMARPIVQ